MTSFNTRRELLRGGVVAGLTLVGGSQALAEEAEKEEIPVSPPEDLMREHGVLRRILLVYEECIRRLQAGKDLPPGLLKNAASIIRSFVEDYHEKQEEDHLFPRFGKAGKDVDLVKVLLSQHNAGRKLTDAIQQSAARPIRGQGEQKLIHSLQQFVRMYRPHAAREDTVLFPALRTIVNPREFADMGEDFERREQQLFGKNGFRDMVERVAGIERELGIYDLAEFTPS